MNLRKKRASNSTLYCIIDKEVAKKHNPESLAKILFRKGASVIQLRYKNRPSFELVRISKKIACIAKRNKKIFLINDRVDVALASAASGVHIGRGDMPVGLVRTLLPGGSLVGKTVHSVKQAKAAKKESVDYISAGPVFFTPIKKHLKKQGAGFIKKIKKTVSVPLFAIGGISRTNIRKLSGSAADGFCVARAALDIKGLKGIINDFN